MSSTRTRIFSAVAVALLGGLLIASPDTAHASTQHTVAVPEADRFAPFAITIHVGDTVHWLNKDTDDHTVVSDDRFNTADNQGVNRLLPGTEANGGRPGLVALHFDKAGTFVYYCRFHAHLNGGGQPVAPGPDGGIQDTNGNYGTPMMGIVTVVA